MDVVEWDVGRAPDLAAAMDASLPAEGLTADELRVVCWDGRGVVLADPGERGAVAVATRSWGELTLAWIRLLVVDPSVRRQGIGRGLLRAAEEWAAERKATEMRWGGSAPCYLWPGVDVEWSATRCLAEAAGYRSEGAEVNMACVTDVAIRVPEGLGVRAVTGGSESAESVLAFAREHWPQWVEEIEIGLDRGYVTGAFRADGSVGGFACHSVLRAGWIGPMAVDPDRSVPGAGGALLGDLLSDLDRRGVTRTEIAWVGPVSFYAKAADAAVSRTFQGYVKSLT